MAIRHCPLVDFRLQYILPTKIPYRVNLSVAIFATDCGKNRCIKPKCRVRHLQQSVHKVHIFRWSLIYISLQGSLKNCLKKEQILILGCTCKKFLHCECERTQHIHFDPTQTLLMSTRLHFLNSCEENDN